MVCCDSITFTISWNLIKVEKCDRKMLSRSISNSINCSHNPTRKHGQIMFCCAVLTLVSCTFYMRIHEPKKIFLIPPENWTLLSLLCFNVWSHCQSTCGYNAVFCWIYTKCDSFHIVLFLYKMKSIFLNDYLCLTEKAKKVKFFSRLKIMICLFSDLF